MKKLHLGHMLVCLCVLAIGSVVGMATKEALASRNAAGTMSGINGPYVSGTTISSSVVNARLADIETEITDSLDRSGKGGMLAALRGTDGTLAAPAFSWTSETGSGLFRNGASDIRMSVGGALRENWTSTGVAITGTASVSGASTLTGNVGIGGAPTNMLDLIGSGSASRTLSNWLEASLADGNALTFNIGKDFSATGDTGIITYTKSATAANSTLCTGVFGGSASTLCVDGNDKVLAHSLTIGGAGTAISASNRGTVSWTPGTVNANTCTQNTVTVTGATAATECAVGSPSVPPSNMTWSCAITANTCTITICNGSLINATGPSGTWSCRAFNP